MASSRTKTPSATLEALLAGPWLLPEPRVQLEDICFGDASYLIVRDDLLHPVAGGNKLRKLDGLLPRLVADGVTDVITCGGVQSSHTTATACLCAERGLRAHLMLRGEAPPVSTGYTLLTELYGQVHYVDRATYRTRPAFMHALAARLREDGRAPAVVPEGGRCAEALLGLIRLVQGLASALEASGRRAEAPWTLVVDSGTGTTAVGLAVGIALAGLPWRVDAVQLIARAETMFEEAQLELSDAFRDHFAPIPESLPLEWVPRAPPRRFGKLLPDELERCRSFARSTGVLVDPIYTLAAVDHIVAASPEDRARMIQIHTGGIFNLMGIAQRLGTGGN